MGFAGLWDIWSNPDGERIESCTIITTAANEVIEPLHDRMPLIIPPDDYTVWLKGMLSSAQLEVYPVSARMNKPENDDPRCIERVA